MTNGIRTASTLSRDWTNLKAVACVLVATGIFALIYTSGRFVGDLASPLQIMFLRYAGGFLTVTTIAVIRGERWQTMQSPNRTNQALRALAGGLGGAAVIFANAHMPLVDANAIGLLSGVFFIALGVTILGERLRSVHVAGGLVCLAGAVTVMMARGAFSNADTNYLAPAAIALAGAALMAVESLYIKILAHSDRPLVTLAHANFFGMLILLIPAAATWGSMGPVNLLLLMLGPLAIFGQYMNIRGYMLAKASVIAPVSYASLIFVALLGWLFFSQIPTSGVVAGAAMIAGGGIVIALSRR